MENSSPAPRVPSGCDRARGQCWRQYIRGLQCWEETQPNSSTLVGPRNKNWGNISVSIKTPMLISLDSSPSEPTWSNQGNAAWRLVCLFILHVQSHQPTASQSSVQPAKSTAAESYAGLAKHRPLCHNQTCSSWNINLRAWEIYNIMLRIN